MKMILKAKKEETMANKSVLLGMLAGLLALGMVVVGCDDGSGDNNSDSDGAKTITITGITGSYNMAMVSVSGSKGSAEGSGPISGGSATISLMAYDEDDYDADPVPFTGSGSFYVMLMVGSTVTSSSTGYVYTNGQSNLDLSTPQKMTQNLPLLSISAANTSIAFNKFSAAPDWYMNSDDD